jgi:outer membrane protein assembly factor BamB
MIKRTRRRRLLLAVGFVVALYLVSYVLMSRVGFRYANMSESAGFYFVPPATPRGYAVHAFFVAAYSPLIALDNFVGTGRPPGEEPLWELLGVSDGGEELETAPVQQEIEFDNQSKRVVRWGPGGRERWSTRIDGLYGLCLVTDRVRVYVQCADGVRALDAETGKVLWYSPGPAHCLYLSGALLVATDGPRLSGRDVVTGKEAFDTVLPAPSFQAQTLEEMAGLFVVQTGEAPGGRGDCFLVDRKGQIFHRFDRQVVAGLQRGGDHVFLTSRDVVRVSASGKVLWSAPFPDPQWIAGGGLVELGGGDLLAFLFSRIADRGVEVVRLDPSRGKKAWEAYCDPLGVTHSAYLHRATVTVQGDRVKVVSRGVRTFVEVLDLGSGRQIERKQGPTR